MTPRLEEAQRLLALARSDRDAFLWMRQGPGIRPAAVFFFAQQSAEKLLKAVMTIKSLVPARTHNLLALAAELNAAGVATPCTPEALAVLNPYAVTFRYDDEDIALVTTGQALEIIDALLTWSEGLIAIS